MTIASQTHAHLNVSRSTVSKWITGENRIRYETLIELCELFDLDAAQRTEWLVLADYLPVAEAQAAVVLPIKRQSYDAILSTNRAICANQCVFGHEATLFELTLQLDQDINLGHWLWRHR